MEKSNLCRCPRKTAKTLYNSALNNNNERQPGPAHRNGQNFNDELNSFIVKVFYCILSAGNLKRSNYRLPESGKLIKTSNRKLPKQKQIFGASRRHLVHTIKRYLQSSITFACWAWHGYMAQWSGDDVFHCGSYNGFPTPRRCPNSSAPHQRTWTAAMADDTRCSSTLYPLVSCS